MKPSSKATVSATTKIKGGRHEGVSPQALAKALSKAAAETIAKAKAGHTKSGKRK